MKILNCKCGQAPKLRNLFCSGQHYRCDCGFFAKGGSAPKTEKKARNGWNKLIREYNKSHSVLTINLNR